MARRDTLFSLRYAVRVLERHSRLWGRIDGLIRFAGLLSGMAAFTALVGQSQSASLGFGVLFALLQALEFTVRPAEVRARSLSARTGYARLLATEGTYDDGALQAAYQALVADDEVVVPESLRALAYNDVLLERGDDPAHLMVLDRWHRFVACLA